MFRELFLQSCNAKFIDSLKSKLKMCLRQCKKEFLYEVSTLERRLGAIY